MSSRFATGKGGGHRQLPSHATDLLIGGGQIFANGGHEGVYHGLQFVPQAWPKAHHSFQRQKVHLQ